MEDQIEGFTAALESGETERVNRVVDDVQDMDLEECAELFDAWFDDLTALYERSDDGYVRQATVRVLETLTPSMAAAVNLQHDPEAHALDLDDVANATDATCGFLLEALVDDDGRVRQSAKRGLQTVFRTYDTLEDDETIRALVAELEAMADEHSGKTREHVLDAKEDAAFTRRSSIGRVLHSTRAALDDRENQ